MNLQDVSKREVLNFGQFLKKVHDCNYKPLSPSNQSEGGMEKSGLSTIKREPAYDYAGYADAVFAGQSKIDVPGVRMKLGKDIGYLDAVSGLGTAQVMSTSESLEVVESSKSTIVRLSDF